MISQSIRRRIVMGGESGELTLSTSSISAAGSGGGNYIYVYWNGVALKDSNVTVSSSQSWVTTTWYSSSGYVNAYCSPNSDLNNSRSALVSIIYKGKTLTCSITQAKGTWDLKWRSYSWSTWCIQTKTAILEVRLNGSVYSGTDYTISGCPSWLTATKSGGEITFTCTNNTGTNKRQATITITFNGESKTETFTQYGTGIVLGTRFSNGNTYSYSNLPSSGTPIGVVIPGINACISLIDMSYKTPDTGATEYNDYGYIDFGGKGYDVPGLTNCTIETDAEADMNGKANTAAILAVDNSSSTAWQTASTISTTDTNQYIHPAAQACWRFHPTGTNKGDWYLPSAGELTTMQSELNNIASPEGLYFSSTLGCTVDILKYKYNITASSSLDGHLVSSTERDADNCWYFYWNGPSTRYYTKSGDGVSSWSSIHARAFMKLS